MFNSISTPDFTINLMLLLGTFQLAWFSVMFFRRGIAPDTIQISIIPLFSLWVLMWPVYSESSSLWPGFLALIIPSTLAVSLHTPFWQQLRIGWTNQTSNQSITLYREVSLPPLAHFIVALMIAGFWFRYIPEFGFGLALCLCLAFPAAQWADRLAAHLPRMLKPGFPAHPDQTLAGHLILIISIIVILSWSLHVYHGTDWKALFIATLITGLTASATRALIPGQWITPAAMLSMGFVMWIL